MSEQIVLAAGDSATVVVVHRDASMSTVEIDVDADGMLGMLIDVDPKIPYGVISRGLSGPGFGLK